MEKVKVNRYITGKRPEYAGESSSSESDSEEEEEEEGRRKEGEEEGEEDAEVEVPLQLYNEADLARDRRLRRLIERSAGER